MRKILLWFIALVFVLAAYLFYNSITGTPNIPVQQSSGTLENIDVPEFDDQSPKIGDTAVGNVELAKFVILNEKTKMVERVVGFEKLLNPNSGSDQWKLQKPYMNIYDDDFRCEITSERGTVRVETVAGNPSPTDAHLIGDVQIHIYPLKEGGLGKSSIYLDDLIYDSERSEFSTDGPVDMISEEGRLVGRGMVLIYNEQLSRVEYFEVLEVDHILIKNIAEKSLDADPEAAVNTEVIDKPDKVATVPVNQDALPAQKSAKTVSSEKPGDSEVSQPDHQQLYQCLFDDNVIIEYGSEIIAAGTEEIIVNNILWKSSSGEKSSDDSGEPKVESDSKQMQTEVVSAPEQKIHAANETPAETNIADIDDTLTGEPVVSVASDEDEGIIDVVVRCNGKLVIKPMESVIDMTDDFDKFSSGPSSAVSRWDDTGEGQVKDRTLFEKDKATGKLSLKPGISKNTDPQAVFLAERINYDMTTGNSFAEGPVEFVFYASEQSKDVDWAGEKIPNVITAQKSAEFFSSEDQIVFKGDVIGTREGRTPGYLQVNKFYGDKLVVDMASAESEENHGADIEHIKVVDGKPRLESIRIDGDDVTISHIVLTCKQIDYDIIDELVLATGPGKIEVNNENAPVPVDKSGSDMSMRRPCFAFIDGFDSLRWLLKDNRVIVDGESGAVYMAYLPVEDGEIGQVVRVYTTHIVADFMEIPMGRNQISRLNTRDGIFYEEVGGNVFKGDRLSYDTERAMMVITGSETQPCFMNGAQVPVIEYDLKTGRKKTKLSSMPGVFNVKPKEK